MRRARLLAVVSACVLLVGCGPAELYSGLSEREVNEMMTVVKEAGIDGGKVSKDGKTWTLVAPGSDFTDAVSLLESRGYPKESYETLGQVFKKDGLLSTPMEEHARLIYGLSQELSNTISTMDGVIVARVHIALPTDDPMAESQKPSSASVFVKYDPQVDVTGDVGQIKALVVNSVEGLPYDRVSVLLSPARSLSLPPRTARNRGPAAYAAIFAGLAGAAGAGALWRLRARRREPLA
jgi:type III secretion protein J